MLHATYASKPDGGDDSRSNRDCRSAPFQGAVVGGGECAVPKAPSGSKSGAVTVGRGAGGHALAGRGVRGGAPVRRAPGAQPEADGLRGLPRTGPVRGLWGGRGGLHDSDRGATEAGRNAKDGEGQVQLSACPAPSRAAATSSAGRSGPCLLHDDWSAARSCERGGRGLGGALGRAARAVGGDLRTGSLGSPLLRRGNLKCRYKRQGEQGYGPY